MSKLSEVGVVDCKVKLFFVKRALCPPLSEENISKYIDIHTWQGGCSAMVSLYTALQGIWNPMLLGNDKGKEDIKVTPRIQQLLTELEATLKVSINQGMNNDERGSRQVNINNFADINEPFDEISFWFRLKSDTRSNYKPLANVIDAALNDFRSDGGSKKGFDANADEILAMDVTEFVYLVSTAQDVLNNVWNAVPDGNNPLVYPQARMSHFFDIIGSTVTRYVCNYLSKVNVWQDPISEVRIKLLYAIQLLQSWAKVPRNLTASYWISKKIDHNWEGKAYIDGYSESFYKRLEDVLSIRVLAEELAQLLTPDEAKTYQIGKLFSTLQDTHPLAYNPYTEPIWQAAKAEYEKKVEPIEAAVATRFKRSLAALERPQLLLNEFQKYKNLVCRPSIRKALAGERDTLLTLLKGLVKQNEQLVEKVENYQYDNPNSDSTSFVSGY